MRVPAGQGTALKELTIGIEECTWGVDEASADRTLVEVDTHRKADRVADADQLAPSSRRTANIRV